MLFDLFGRSRPRCAPRPCGNRVRCTVELLESRLALSGTSLTDTSTVAPPPAPSGTDTTLTAPTNDTTSTTTSTTSTTATPPAPTSTVTAPVGATTPDSTLDWTTGTPGGS